LQFTYFPPEERGKLWPYEARTKWRWWTALLMTVLIVLAGSVAATFVGAFFQGFFGALGRRSGAIAQAPRIQEFQIFSLILVNVFWALFSTLAARAGGAKLSDVIALKRGVGGWKMYAECLFAVACLIAVYGSIATFVFQVNLIADALPIASMLWGSWWPLALFAVVVGAPVAEEFLFRGFLQTALMPTFLGYWGSALVATIAWTLLHAHYSIPSQVQVFLMGVLCAWYLRRSGSLYLAMFCHGCYNLLISLGVMLLPKAWYGF
jgi:uncharacterized protein